MFTSLWIFPVGFIRGFHDNVPYYHSWTTSDSWKEYWSYPDTPSEGKSLANGITKFFKSYLLWKSSRCLIRNITYSFNTLDSLLILYLKLVITKLEYAWTMRNATTSTDKKSCNIFSGSLQPYVKIISLLMTMSWWLSWNYIASYPHGRRLSWCITFYLYLFRFKMSPSPLVTTGIQVLPRYFRNSSPFYRQM